MFLDFENSTRNLFTKGNIIVKNYAVYCWGHSRGTIDIGIYSSERFVKMLVT